MGVEFEDSSKFMVKLRASHLRYEIAHILGDTEVPFMGTLKDEEAETKETCPTMRIHELYTRFGPRMDQYTSGIQYLTIGGASMPTKYASPFPAEVAKEHRIAICDKCLEYFPSEFVFSRHRDKCLQKHPPGREIYRDQSLSMWEVDGCIASLYCQNLCLLAKLFLDSKSVFNDVEPFMFYVATREDSEGAHFVGYFSKQKIYASIEPAQHPIMNVSCIMALPAVQGRGWGQFLISFSYLLTRRQQTSGTPERPLSRLGLLAYENYWRMQVCYVLSSGKKPLSIRSLSNSTGMTPDDCVYALELLGWFRPELGGIVVDWHNLQSRIKAWESKNPMKVKDELLIWSPQPAW